MSGHLWWLDGSSEGEKGLSYANTFQWFLVAWKGSGLSVPGTAWAAQCGRSSSEQWVSVLKTALAGHFRLVTRWSVLVPFVIEISLGLCVFCCLTKPAFKKPVLLELLHPGAVKK